MLELEGPFGSARLMYSLDKLRPRSQVTRDHPASGKPHFSVTASHGTMVFSLLLSLTPVTLLHLLMSLLD